MLVLKRGLDMDVMEKHLEVKETEKHRLDWGWESVFHHVSLSFKHLNYLQGKGEFSTSLPNLFPSFSLKDLTVQI